MADGLEAILKPVAKPLEIDPQNRPHVVLLVGVNGSGKTTTAGKLAQNWQAEGKTVLLAAGDTFRAAAVEQLQIWGERTGTKVIADATGGDAAALAYRAMVQAKEDNADVLIIDTAGRLQNRSELMDELAKIVRVIRKLDDSAPHDSVIVLDGTVGQNAMSQVKAFSAVADLSGLIVTKLDGSAKGGVVVALAEEFGNVTYRSVISKAQSIGVEYVKLSPVKRVKRDDMPTKAEYLAAIRKGLALPTREGDLTKAELSAVLASIA